MKFQGVNHFLKNFEIFVDSNQYTLIKMYLWVPSEYTYNAAMLFCSFGSFIQALSDYLLSILVTLFPFPFSRKTFEKTSQK